MVNKHEKLFSWPSEKCRLKTPFRSHLTPLRIAVIKTTALNSGLDVNEREPIGTSGGMKTSQVTMEISVGFSQKTQNSPTV